MKAPLLLGRETLNALSANIFLFVPGAADWFGKVSVFPNSILCIELFLASSLTAAFGGEPYPFIYSRTPPPPKGRCPIGKSRRSGCCFSGRAPLLLPVGEMQMVPQAVIRLAPAGVRLYLPVIDRRRRSWQTAPTQPAKGIEFSSFRSILLSTVCSLRFVGLIVLVPYRNVKCLF